VKASLPRTGPDQPDGDVVRVPTVRVDAVIDLQDVLDRVRGGAAARAGGPGAANQDALSGISELAARLSPRSRLASARWTSQTPRHCARQQHPPRGGTHDQGVHDRAPQAQAR
jgi:hypothetical protein